MRPSLISTGVNMTRNWMQIPAARQTRLAITALRNSSSAFTHTAYRSFFNATHGTNNTGNTGSPVLAQLKNYRAKSSTGGIILNKIHKLDQAVEATTQATAKRSVLLHASSQSVQARKEALTQSANKAHKSSKPDNVNVKAGFTQQRIDEFEAK